MGIACTGERKIPFTTGILVGIGETAEDVMDSLLAIRDLHLRYGHIQEVIVQNFVPKPEIPMASWPAPSPRERALWLPCSCGEVDTSGTS